MTYNQIDLDGKVISDTLNLKMIRYIAINIQIAKPEQLGNKNSMLQVIMVIHLSQIRMMIKHQPTKLIIFQPIMDPLNKKRAFGGMSRLCSYLIIWNEIFRHMH
jgi:hypothetical protein